MTKKSIKYLMIAFCVLILTTVGFFYMQYTHFSTESIVSVQISNQSDVLEETFEFDGDHLFTAYDSMFETSPPTEILASSHYLQIKNSFGNYMNFEILTLTTDGFVLKEVDNKKYYLLPHSNQMSSSKALRAFYEGQISTKLFINNIALENKKTFDWSYLSHDNQWIKIDDIIENTGINPEISITTPDQTIQFASEKEVKLGVLKIIDAKTESTVYEGIIETENLYMPTYDGTFRYELQLIYKDDLKYKGEVNASFNVSLDLPIDVQLDSSDISIGGFTSLKVFHADENQNLKVHNLPFDIQFTTKDHVQTAILYADYRAKAGQYPFEITTEDGQQTWQFNLNINSRNFHVQHLIIDEKVASSTKNDAANEEFARLYTPLRAYSSEEDLTSGPYTIPALGRLSTEYGETRHVNGAATSYRHSGLDIAAPRGTSVFATNSGKVVFAAPLILTGNTILIDHGQGFFSTYFHLDSLNVQPDQMVENGALIGTIGTTGFSTGPHLHFIISYHEHNLEPGYFLVNEPITYDNYKNYLK